MNNRATPQPIIASCPQAVSQDSDRTRDWWRTTRVPSELRPGGAAQRVQSMGARLARLRARAAAARWSARPEMVRADRPRHPHQLAGQSAGSTGPCWTGLGTFSSLTTSHWSHPTTNNKQQHNRFYWQLTVPCRTTVISDQPRVTRVSTRQQGLWWHVLCPGPAPRTTWSWSWRTTWRSCQVLPLSRVTCHVSRVTTPSLFMAHFPQLTLHTHWVKSSGDAERERLACSLSGAALSVSRLGCESSHHIYLSSCQSATSSQLHCCLSSVMSLSKLQALMWSGDMKMNIDKPLGNGRRKIPIYYIELKNRPDILTLSIQSHCGSESCSLHSITTNI